MTLQFGTLTIAVVLFLYFVTFAVEGWLPPVVMFGGMGALFLSIAWATLADSYLRTTDVLLDAEKVEVKSSLYGREETDQYALNDKSHARQWYLRHSAGSDTTPRPRGIEIGSNRYDTETGSELIDDTRARFGKGLCRGELDWLEWRINHFLDSPPTPATTTSVPQTSECDRSRRPPDISLQVEEDGKETRLLLPNTSQTRTYTGLSTAIIGFAVAGISLFFSAQWWHTPPKHIPGPPIVLWLGLSVGLLFCCLGIVAVLNGLTRMFGQRTLTISPKTIEYRTSLCSVPVWWTLPTAEVVSVWKPDADGSVRSVESVLPVQDRVIRTPTREVQLSWLSDVVSDRSHAEWLANLLNNRIGAAKSAPA